MQDASWRWWSLQDGLTHWAREAKGSPRFLNANHLLDVMSSTEMRARREAGGGQEWWGEGKSSDPTVLRVQCPRHIQVQTDAGYPLGVGTHRGSGGRGGFGSRRHADERGH